MKYCKMLRLDRTEAEKERRRLYGDQGALFSRAKRLAPRNDDCSNCVTSVEKDNLVMTYEEIYDWSIEGQESCDGRFTQILELGGAVSFAITTADKNSYVVEYEEIHTYERDICY